MVTELIKPTLEFRSLSDNPDGNDESVEIGDEEPKDPAEEVGAGDDAEGGEELMG